MVATNKENGEIIRPDIRSYAAEFNVPGAAQPTPQNETLSPLQGASQKDGAASEVAMSDAEDKIDRSVGPSNQDEEVFENASLAGIEKVIAKSTYDAIRRVTVDGGLKVAVTMVFPRWGGPVQCLMSLDVCERDVKWLAKTLFNANVKWVDQVLHVPLAGGITLTIPNSEATLKGVPGEAIIEVFGHEIHKAIIECPIRKRELTEGKHLTECVSMILMKNGGIINLSLGLEQGLRIQEKLYT
ncbi:hypothetical protein P154DRAFT_561393 [Amniculicola lignicola CBS 123094]|uniref:Uncharacterized protein n=1 Tax=Amniculicola lignicola CBS 123094 TaxID=1392246 RepID=A0A6A5WQC4_9PLEO|nr:hypothetical protein P154DRAFT_561393 [Amniculicola lignicola CBS 123094]